MRLSIVVPAHNEEQRIGRMLDAYLPFFSARYGHDVELIVVVNGSRDDTAGVVASYATRYPMLKPVIEPEPIGKGGALIMGFKAAQGDLVGFVDADGATPPEAFQALVDGIGDAGVIIASRWSRGAQVSPRQPLERRLASRAFNSVVRLLFGLRLTDTQCGAKLMRREALKGILPRLGITRWAFDVDLLFQLRRAGHRIREIPTVWHDVAGSKLEIGKATTETMLALTRLRLLYSPFRWVVGLYDRFLGPWIHPVGEMRDHLLTHSLMMFAGAQMGNICNFLFQTAMMRMNSAAEYAVLSAMLALVVGVGMPLGALGGAITHYAARFASAGEGERIKAMMLALGRDLAIPSVLIMAVAIVGHREIMAFLRLESPWPLYLTAAIIVAGFYAALPTSVLTGVQAFEWAATIGNSWSVVRLVLGVLAVFLGMGVAGALTAHLAGVLAGAILALIAIGRITARAARPAPAVRAARPEGFYGYMAGYMGAFVAYAVLSNADVVLVKHYFHADEAGLFAKAAMVARIVFFLPAPVAAAMFPKVTSAGESTVAGRRMLIKAMVLSAAIIAPIGIVCLLAPGPILTAMAGGASAGQVAIVRGMVLALAPLTLLFLLLNYELAQRRFAITIPMGIGAAAYVAGAAVWHATPMQIVTVLGVVSATTLAVCLVFFSGRVPRPAPG